jgi:predicted GNAT family acetyltransferase
MPDTPTVSQNEAASQFEIRSDDGVGFLEYSKQGDTLDLVRTEVPTPLEGRGHGSALARAALEYAREHHLKVIPTCRFIRAYMERHQEYDDLLA